MNVIKLSVLVILLVVAMIAYRVFQAAPPPPPPEPAAEVTERLAPVTRPTGTSLETFVPPVASNPGEEQPDCLTRDELNAHPLVRQLRSQAESAATNDADVEKFRGIDDASVQGFADQGDSAAMAVVGAMSVMRAYRMDVSSAVDWLANGGELEGVVMQQQQMSSDASLALNDAAYWFYQAALNGRVAALRHYGQVRGQLFGGPVGLGWIGQPEYDALGPEQQQELWPVNIYGHAATAMTPSPDESAIQSSAHLASASELVGEILGEIRNEFDLAVVDAGLPQPATSASDIAAFERLKSQVCEPESSRP